MVFRLLAILVLPGLPVLRGLFLIPARGMADALVLTKAMTASTIAENFVEEGAVRVTLEIGSADLAACDHIMPDEIYDRLGREPSRMEARVWPFLSFQFGAEVFFTDAS